MLSLWLRVLRACGSTPQAAPGCLRGSWRAGGSTSRKRRDRMRGTRRSMTNVRRLQVVRKGDDAKAHKELNALGGDGGGEKEMDTAKAQDALSKLDSVAAAEMAARLERERELAKVKIDSNDVKLIVDGASW